jgi:hypothetical protein
MLSFKQYSILFEEFEKVSSRLGTNEGGIFADKATGEHAYIKFPTNEEQAKVEVATDHLYKHMGIPTLNASLYKVGDRLGVKTPWRDGLKELGNPLHRSFSEDEAKSLATMLHAATITKNWDITGIDHTNVMHDGTKFLSGDQGGSMHFRAQGGSKKFDSDIEGDEFKNPAHPAGMLRHSLEQQYPRVMHDTIGTVKKLTDSHIDETISSIGLDSKYGDVIKQRRDALLKNYGVEPKSGE